MTSLRRSIQEGVLFLALESDDGLPKLSRAVMEEIGREFAVLAVATDVLGCVLTGTEKAFAAGADIDEISQLTSVQAHEFSRAGQAVMRAVAESGKPVLAAVRGYCMGGGFDLALACHTRIATADAVFAHPGGAIGILTGWGGTQRLARLIGRAQAPEILITGRRVHAADALACGLVEAIFPEGDLLPSAAARVRAIARRWNEPHGRIPE